MIRHFEILFNNAFEAAEFWCTVDLKAMFITKEALHFSLIGNFYCCLAKEG